MGIFIIIPDLTNAVEYTLTRRADSGDKVMEGGMAGQLRAEAQCRPLYIYTRRIKHSPLIDAYIPVLTNWNPVDH